jgi:hypothetical protein
VYAHVLFIIRTGKVYPLEDYLRSIDPARTSYVSAAFQAREEPTSQQAMELLLRTYQETPEPERKRRVLLVIDILNFIASTGRYADFEEYLENYYVDAPWAIAHFDSRAEAEAWLNGLAEPPSWAYVLVGDEYFELWYSREEGERGLRRDYVMEQWLEDFTHKGLPPPVASFNTPEEARAWLESHPASPMTFVTISGEYHLAVHHRKLDRHTLHPLSRLAEWKARKQRAIEGGHDRPPGPGRS